ncbi:hypothetical protein, partial [Klebsiella pneumoniae]
SIYSTKPMIIILFIECETFYGDYFFCASFFLIGICFSTSFFELCKNKNYKLTNKIEKEL